MSKRRLPAAVGNRKKQALFRENDSMAVKGAKLRKLQEIAKSLPNGPKKTAYLRDIENAKEQVDAALRFRDKLRTNALNIGRPVHKIAKTGLNILNSADKGLEKLEKADIPFLSEFASGVRDLPGYESVMSKSKEGEKYLDKGTEFIKKADEFAMGL